MEKYRPKLNLPLSSTEQFYDRLTLVGLLLLFLLPALNYASLPDEIPTHFNGRGEADDWSSKHFIWMLPILGLLLATGMHWLTKIPHTYNYSSTLTPENVEQQYIRSRTVLRFFNVFDTLLFLGITWMIIQKAKGNLEGVQSWLLPAILLSTLLAIGYALYMAYRKD